MSITILKGTVVSAPALGKLEITEGGCLVAEDGNIAGVFPALPERYAGAPVEDYGDALILQSFADLHLHAPQYPMLGMGMDLPLAAVRRQIASGVDIIVHLGRLRDKSRRVLEIVEVLGFEKDEIITHPLYQFQETGEEEGKVMGEFTQMETLVRKNKLHCAGLSL